MQVNFRVIKLVLLHETPVRKSYFVLNFNEVGEKLGWETSKETES